MDMLATRFQVIDDAPDHSFCKRCGVSCKLVWYAQRSAIDVTTDGQALLDIKVGVYKCGPCKVYFRNCLSYISPKALFTNRVANIAVASVVEDLMPVSKVVRRIERDFGVKVSETAIRKWVAKAAQFVDKQKDSLEAKVIGETSGVLCIDEAYSGSLGILLATNPNQKDELLGYLVSESSFDSNDVEKFLKKLKQQGIEPNQVITDESALYPEVIKTVWPKTKHQLCLFHMSQKLVRLAKKAVWELKKSLPKPPKSEAKKQANKSREFVENILEMNERGVPLRKIARDFAISRNTLKNWIGNPNKFIRKYQRLKDYSELLTKEVDKNQQTNNEILAEGWESWDQIKDVRNALTKLAFDISRNESFAREESQKRYLLVKQSPLANQIEEIRTFMERWYAIWLLADGGIANLESARTSWNALADWKLSFSDQFFGKFQSKMSNKLFDSLSTHFQCNEFQSTNNSAERYARLVKKIQKTTYRIRSQNHLADRILLHELMRKRQIQNKDLHLSSPYK